MKESITKFDLEAAFKALDDIDIPIAEKGINANKPALAEIFSRKSKFDSLFEEYYDISSSEELGDAKEAREAEVAKAKLARIEKIVDLDADSPDDLLTSYVGKYIIQCPQCMTLFYKNPEDVEESEDDPKTVNVNEVCQHCGNESGYLLIGKVGEATEEEVAAENTDLEPSEDEELIPEENEATEGEKTSEEEPTEESEETFDLDSDLEARDLEIEDDETGANESLQTETTNTTSLTEDLTEDVELDTSAEDFEKLINSPEFKKPVSDSDVRAMMNEFSETEEDVQEALTEGGLGTLGKALGKKISQNRKKLKDKVSTTIDKLAENADTREEKADWILANARNDYKNIQVDNSGKLVPDEKNQRFHNFIVIGFKETYSNGKQITMAPSFNNKDLVIGMNKPEVKTTYKDADNVAKGWSMSQGNGPAFIYLAKSAEDNKAVFLCEYFKGELENDQLEKYFEVVKKDIEAGKLMAKGKMNQADNENEETAATEEKEIKEIKASQVKQGMKIQFADEEGEVIEIGKSKFGNNYLTLKVKFADGKVESMSIAPEATISMTAEALEASEAATESFKKDSESLSTFMKNLENLQEDSLEKKITDSLIESYKNVAGFRLTGCSYLNEQLKVDGTIFFTSGRTRKTTYAFSEAYTDKIGRASFSGLNEKLGLDKQFTMSGKIDTDSRTFITEAFESANK